MQKALCLMLIFLSTLMLYAREVRLARIENNTGQAIGEIIMQKLCDSIGTRVRIEAYPGRRCTTMALSGQVDGEIMRIYSYRVKHPQLIRVPSPYYALETTVFTLKNRSVTVRTKDDLRGYTIVVVRGVQHTADMTEGLSGVTEVNSTEQMMQFLKAGRADIALANRIDGIAVLSRLKIDSIVPRTTLNTQNLYCYVHPKMKDLVPRLDRAIREMTASGKLARISRDAESAVLGRH